MEIKEKSKLQQLNEELKRNKQTLASNHKKHDEELNKLM